MLAHGVLLKSSYPQTIGPHDLGSHNGLPLQIHGHFGLDNEQAKVIEQRLCQRVIVTNDSGFGNRTQIGSLYNHAMKEAVTPQQQS
jgi:hypothetical protein